MSYFSSHYSHRYAAPAPTAYYSQPQPSYGYPAQAAYASPPMATPAYINAQGVSVAPTSYYDSMNASPILPPQYNEHAVAPSPYPMIDQHPHRMGGLKNQLKARISQKYHMYDIPSNGYPQPGVVGDSYLQQQQQHPQTYPPQPPQQQHPQTYPPQPQQQQHQQYPTSPVYKDPVAPLELSPEYLASAPQPLPDVRSSYSNPPTVRTPGYSSPQHASPSFATAAGARERPRSLPHAIAPLSALPPQSQTPGSSRVNTAAPPASRSANSSPTPAADSSAPAPRTHHHHHHHSRPNSTSASPSSTASGRAVVAAIPTNMAHEERRQLALNLLNEIDAYERMQNRVFLFRLLPPLRFRVTVVRNVDGRPQQTETMMTMAELRAQLQHALDHDSQMVDQLGMTYENLVGLTRVQQGVKDASIFPTFSYTNDCHVPSDKSTCSVCLADFVEGDILKTVPCMHLFHTECIDEWLKMSKVCPVCKTCVEDDTACVDDDDDCCKGKKNL